MPDRQFMIDFYYNSGVANINSLQGLESIAEKFSLRQYPAIKYYKEIRELFGHHPDDLDIEDKLRNDQKEFSKLINKELARLAAKDEQNIITEFKGLINIYDHLGKKQYITQAISSALKGEAGIASVTGLSHIHKELKDYKRTTAYLVQPG